MPRVVLNRRASWRLAWRLCAALLVSLAATARADEAPGPWERVSDSDGIDVQRRAVAGSNLKEFQGSGVVEAPLGRVLAVVRDGSRRVEWMPACSGAWVIEENEAARVQISYHRTHAPWPASDRDSINRAHMVVEPAQHRVVLSFEAIDYPKVPPVKGAVRMPFLRGHWILTAIHHGAATHVEYRVHANPGGMLPDWLANLASKSLPRETIAGLRRQAAKARYPEFEAVVMKSPEMAEMMGGLE